MNNVRSRFDQNTGTSKEDAKKARDAGEESLTHQSFKKEADINTITNRFLKTGVLGNPGASRRPMFGNFTGVDFQAMQNLIVDAKNAFMALPASVRRRFNDDAGQVVRFCQDPRNLEEAVKLGLVEVPEGHYVHKGKILPIPKEEKEPEAPKADPEANPNFKKEPKAP